MGSGPGPIETRTYAGPSGTAQGIEFNVGDDEVPNWIDIRNPGTVDLAEVNPELYLELQERRGRRDEFSDSIDYLFDPAAYDERREEAIRRRSTQLGNLYAARGLSGSSVELGDISENARQIDFAFKDRQLGDQIRALQMENLLQSGVEADILRGQAGFAGFQQQYLDTLLGLRAGDEAAAARNASIWGSIISGLATAGGAVAGGLVAGPPGAAAGAGLGSALSRTGQMAVDAIEPPAVYGGSGYAPGYFDY